MKIKKLEDIDYNVWRQIVELYLGNPIQHCYLIYDLIYYIDLSQFIFIVDGGGLEGYILVWRGGKPPSAHIYGNVEPRILLDHVEEDNLRLHIPNSLAEEYLEYLGGRTRLQLEGWYLDMAVDKEDFKPIEPIKPKRLNVGEDLEPYLQLKRIQLQDASFKRELAIERLEKWHYYGVYSGGKLVSIAAAYLKLPEIWCLGDVYTYPEYRGRGYATSCTSAVTRDAINSGAKVLLHVNSANKQALKIYGKLGYKSIGRRLWVKMWKDKV